MNIALSTLVALEPYLLVSPSLLVMCPLPTTKSWTRKTSRCSNLLTEATSIQPQTPNPTQPNPTRSLGMDVSGMVHNTPTDTATTEDKREREIN